MKRPACPQEKKGPVSTLNRSDPFPSECLHPLTTTQPQGTQREQLHFPRRPQRPLPVMMIPTSSSPPLGWTLTPSGITKCCSVTSRKCLVHRTVILRKGSHHSLMRPQHVP